MPNGMSIGSAVSVCVPNAMLYSALSMGKIAKPFAFVKNQNNPLKAGISFP